MILRPYQTECVERVLAAYAGGKNAPVIVAATGAGKSVIIGEIIRRVNVKGTYAIVMAHRTELIEQLYEKVRATGVRAGIIKSGDRREDRSARVQVASVQTLVNRLKPSGISGIEKWKPLCDLLIQDEVHHFSKGNSYDKIIKAYPSAKILGATATPERTDGAGLGDLFDEMILVSSPAELMLEGFLCQYEVYESPMKLDFSGAKRIRGELDEKAVSIIVDKPKVIGNVFETWMRHAQGKPTLVFARNRQHGEHLRDVFVQGGITCKYVDDATSAHDRAKAIEDYKARKVTVLVNIGLFTEGTDLPLTECIQMTWQTMSLIKYLQMAGRGLRPSPGKSALTILDHGNNVRLHGLPDDPREWSLEGRKKRPTAKITSVATCPMCFHLFAARTRECPKCGFQVIAAGDPLPDFVDVELVKRALPTPAERKQAATLELDSQRAVLNDLMAERAMMNKGWKWPLVEYRKRFGKFPREKHGVKVDYQRGRNGYEISAWYLDGRRVGGIAPTPAPVSDEELFA